MIALPRVPSSTPNSLFPNNLGCSFAFSDHYTNSTNLDLHYNNSLFTTTTLDHHQTKTPNILADSKNFSSISHLQLPQHFDHLTHTPISTAGFSSCEPTPPPTMVIKKLHHNASERDRRKKMNTLYSSLRSLLPASDQMKKMSIPTTVARVVKYIPELQRELEKLINKKQKLLSRIAKQEDDVLVHQENQRNQIARSSIFPSTSFSAISVNRLGRREVVIQIPAHKAQDRPLSDLLLSLEEDGLLLLNASSFQSFGGKLLVFYNLHFQVRENYEVECDDLNEKIVSLFEKRGMHGSYGVP